MFQEKYKKKEENLIVDGGSNFFKKDIEFRIFKNMGIGDTVLGKTEKLNKKNEEMISFLCDKTISEELNDSIRNSVHDSMLSIRGVLNGISHVENNDERIILETLTKELFSAAHDYVCKIISLRNNHIGNGDEENDSKEQRLKELEQAEKERDRKHTTFRKKLAVVLERCKTAGLKGEVKDVIDNLIQFGLPDEKTFLKVFLGKQTGMMEELREEKTTQGKEKYATQDTFDSVDLFALALACAEKIQKKEEKLKKS